MSKMNKIKNIAKNFKLPLLFALLFTVLLPGKVFAADFDLTVHSILPSNTEGAYVVSWTDNTSGLISATTIRKTGTERNMDKYTGDSGQGFKFSATHNTSNNTLNLGAYLQSGSVKINGTTTSTGWDAVTNSVPINITAKTPTGGDGFGGFREAEQGLGQQGRDGMPGGNTTTNVPNSANGGGDCGVQGGTSVIKCGDGDPLQEMILYFTSFFFAGVGVVSIIGIIIGGVVYITAGGDAAKTKQGITYIVNAVIALVVFIFLFMLLNFLVPGGFFNNAGFEAEPSSPGVTDPNGLDEDTCQQYGLC